VVAVDGGPARRLTKDGGRDSRPVWSPDGGQIAFASDRSGSPELFVMDADSGAPTRIAAQPLSADPFAWSPDGGRIAFASGTYGARRILVVDADGGGLRALLSEDRDALSTVAAPK